jgi:hypothetical protein
MRKIMQYVMNIRMNQAEISTVLRGAGFRATPGRISVLKYLATQMRPVGIEVIERKFPKVNKIAYKRYIHNFIKEADSIGHNFWEGFCHQISE